MVRTLFIGLDGFTFHVLDDLVTDKAGRGIVMPFMGQLLAEGFRAPLRSTPHPLTPPAWTSMFTGKNPGEHGIYDFMRSEDKGREVFFTLYDFRDIQTETVWSIASRSGRCVASLNFPMMAPPPRVNGSVIPGFTSARHLRRNSMPEDLFDHLSQVPGFSPQKLSWDFEKENEVGSEMDDDYLWQWINYHLPREELWYSVARFLMEKDQPDLVAVMFDGADKIQHQAWQFIDPDLRPEHADERFQKMHGVCMEYFRRLDGYIQGLVEAAGPNTQVFLASDHGFTTTTNVLRINRYLSELGHLVYQQVGDDESVKRRANSPFAYLDWTKTKAYCPTPSSNAIRIRVAKNAGEPGVAPDDYHSFRELLIRQLYACRDPDTGEQLITRVLKREEVFPGGAMQDAPDLTLELSDNGFVSIRNLDPVVVKRGVPAGTHHPYGIFLAYGQGIEKNKRGEPLQIVDVAATLLHSLGLPVPVDFEGRVATACFEAAQMELSPATIGPATIPIRQLGGAGTATQDAGIPDAEKQKILDQLAMLGYLEE
jgi:predicted AlkP superfamily phosphohydrolase/phosphomutase